MNKYLKLFLERLEYNGLFNWIPDKAYLKFKARVYHGKKLDLKHPKTFTDKLQWLKLYNRKPVYTEMVDKDLAKKYVSERIGEEYIIPTFGVWDKFEDIDFDMLPEQFVLKCTHDSGGLSICRDKSKFDRVAAKKKIESAFKRNYFYSSREWPYKNVKPRILAEMYMEDEESSGGLTDYKFYCFNGEPKFLYISRGLENHATANISFVNLDWTFAEYERSDYKPFDKLPPRPATFDRMLEICGKLSEGIPFLRVDLYQIKGKIYFSEMTFFPCAGYMPFKNPEHDLELGNMIELPNKE